MQGDREFQAEVQSLSRYKHPNIVVLMGLARGPNRERAIVYEMAAHGSLRDCLDCKHGRPTLTWAERMTIVRDVAYGLSFLQTAIKGEPVFHLDLKTDNVLVDSTMHARISDFGLARVGCALARASTSQTGTQVFRVSEPVGTNAYICPELLSEGVVSRRTDVHAYGIILLEVVTGRPPNNLRGPVKISIKPPRGSIRSVLDPKIAPWAAAAVDEANKVVQLAMRCTERSRVERPTLTEIIALLNGEPYDASADLDCADTGGAERECIVRMDGPIKTMFEPCHHSAVCVECAKTLMATTRRCPICRVPIERYVEGDFMQTFVG